MKTLFRLGRVLGVLVLFLLAAVPGLWAGSIVAGADVGASPQVKVFSTPGNSEERSFFAYSAGFTGGVRVALGDVTGDGTLDIITAAGVGGNGHVKVFDGM